MFWVAYFVITILGVLFTLLWSVKSKSAEGVENDDIVILSMISFIPVLNVLYLVMLIMTFIVNAVRKE